LDYKRIYKEIIDNRKNNILIDVYTENHHIIPRSLGGSDNLDNLVKLTSREHFICHYILTKIYTKYSFNWYKMNHAFMMMKVISIHHDRYFNSRLYESLRGDFSLVMSKSQSGNKNSQYDTIWVYNIKSRKNKKINKNCEIPNGYAAGRILKKYKIKHDSHVLFYKKHKLKFETEYYWKIFLDSDYDSIREFCRNIYPKSHVSFTKNLKKYIPNYNAIQGKKFNMKENVINTILDDKVKIGCLLKQFNINVGDTFEKFSTSIDSLNSGIPDKYSEYKQDLLNVLIEEKQKESYGNSNIPKLGSIIHMISLLE